MEIIGHTAQLSYLKNQKEHEILSHAYLFIGSHSVGKRTVTDWFVSQFPKSENIFIEQDEPENEEVKKRISIKSVRSALAQLSRSTFGGAYRCIIIDNAELLTEEASNALLKKLEEPPLNTIFIFIAPTLLHVLPTLASRCQTVRFTQPSSHDIQSGSDLEVINKEFEIFIKLGVGYRLLEVQQMFKTLEQGEQYIHHVLQKSLSRELYQKAGKFYSCLRKGYRQRQFSHIERIRDVLALV